MKLLLTGATGFVGFNLLLQALRDPRVGALGVAVRRAGKLAGLLAAEGFAGLPPGLRVMEGDARGWRLGCKASGWLPDVCVHCAGVLFARRKQEYFAGNVDGAARLLEELPPSCRLIALSSQSASGPTPPNRPFRDESDPDSPLSFYGQSKLAMERLLESHAEKRPVLILRPPTVLGPHDSATLPLFQMARSPIWIKPGCRVKRLSWIAAADLANAILEAAANPAANGTYFVNGPSPTTDIELLREAGKIAGRRGLVVPVPTPLLRAASGFSALIPAIGRAVPSLTPDRSKELLEDRWLISGTRFSQTFHWSPRETLPDTLRLAAESYRSRGLIPPMDRANRRNPED